MKKLLRVLGRLFLALLFLAAAALVTLGLLRWRGLILLPDEADPDEWEVFGVDVSSYQGEVDWPVLAEQGVDFAFIKATEGSLLQDRRFAANWAGAAAAGVRAGAYHFLSYDSPGETQADNFIAAVPVTEGALPPVVDIEFYGEYLDTPPEKERVRAILDPLLERLEELNQIRQTTILMVTHDAFTASYCRRILFLQDGAVLTQLERGGQSRRAFFQQIIGVVTRLGGDQSDVL